MSSRNTELVLRELMQDRPEQVVSTAIAARKAVLKLAGECSELIYETYCISNAFTFTGKQGQGFIHIATYAKHVNLGFDYGTKLEDPEGLLQGTGKLIRHIRLNGGIGREAGVSRQIDQGSGPARARYGGTQGR